MVYILDMNDEYSILFDKYLKLSDEKKALKDCVLKAIEDSFGRKSLDVLDVGCGDGKLSSSLAKEGHKVSAIDVRDSFIEANVNFESIGFLEYSTEKKFDLIIMAYFLWEIPLDKWDDVFLKCKQLLNGGGKIFVVDVCNEGKFDNIFFEFNLVQDRRSHGLQNYWERYCEKKCSIEKKINFNSSLIAANPSDLYEAIAFFFKEPLLEDVYIKNKQEFIDFFEKKKRINGKIRLISKHSLDVIVNTL